MSENRRANDKIILVGNANVGKTTLYNFLTHSFEHIGNWHGVTVSAVEKKILYKHNELVIEDLPGIYSLTIYSGEEAVSRDSILSSDYKCLVNICEVNNIPRNLYLTMQLLELGIVPVLCVNMVDELKKIGKSINYRLLEKRLGMPVIPVSAKYHSDVHLLLDTVLEHMRSQHSPIDLPYLKVLPLDDIMTIICKNADAAGLKTRYAAIKIIENDSFVIDKLALSDEQKQVLTPYGALQAELARLRYDFICSITDEVIIRNVSEEHHEMHEHAVHGVPLETNFDENTDAGGQATTDINSKRALKHKKHHDKHRGRDHGYSVLDKVLLNKYLAFPILFLLFALIFYLTFFVIGKPVTGGMEYAIDNWIYAPIVGALENAGVTGWVVALVGDGIINGLGGIIIFLPQVVLLFLFLAFLEDSGYLSRVAFMTDGVFRKLGLSGRSVFTMLMGFGCSATAVLTARNMEDPRVRRKTVLLTPFMSCSARLPVYTVVAGTFFGGSWIIIFGLYLMGIAVALLLAWISERFKKLRSGAPNFIMEIPPYRLPTFSRVLILLWKNVKMFLIRIGTIIFALNIIVWLLSNFSFGFKYIPDDMGSSMLGIISSLLAPVFIPLGFGSWQATTGLIAGFVAKEAVSSTLEALGDIQSFFPGGVLAAFSYVVFVLLYVPCLAAVSSIAKELGGKWAWVSIALHIGTAYIISLIVFQGGTFFRWLFTEAGTGGIISACIVAAVLITVVIIIVRAVKRRGACTGCACNCKNNKNCR